MRKKINIFLGALIAILGSCKTSKPTIVPNDRIMVMYGPPAYFQQQQSNITQSDTTKQEIKQIIPSKVLDKK